MKVQKIAPENNNKQMHTNTVPQHNYAPSFKSGAALTGALNLFGRTMQGIENGGFLASFLIQDALGMTMPRVGAAFLRDKEVTGKYNIQEGFEVLGREGLTGPCMMAVAPIMFALAAKFGRSTSINSQLIRRFGDSFKELITRPNFNKDLLKNKEQFKKEFFTKNIREMLTNTLGEGNFKEESVEFILKKIANYENIPADAVLPKNLLGIKSKSKYKASCIADIVEHINNIKYSTSNDLTLLNKLKLGSEELNSVKSFSTKNAIDGMIKYSDDAITLNKKILELDELMAEGIKNKSIAKRFISNIATIAATLGVLSGLPKLYMRSSISPGAKTAMQLKEAKDAEKQNGEISFKAKPVNKSMLTKLGEFLSKFTEKDFIAKELEYNGHNFTNSLMAGLSMFGLLLPRGLKAYNRAQIDDNGKRDLTEVYEILIRDLSSSLLVVFAVPMLTRAAVTAYENKSGFVLMHKNRDLSKKATLLDLLNPYSKAHVLTNSEINALYNGIDSKKKMINFCEYIDKNNGDLQKILSKSENFESILKENGFNLKDLEKLSKSDKNKRLTSFFKKFGEGKAEEVINEAISKLMKGNSCKPKSNKILGFARGLNSVPGVITTFLISPYLLGWLIPRLTYANTRRIHEKAEKEKAQNLNTAV